MSCQPGPDFVRWGNFKELDKRVRSLEKLVTSMRGAENTTKAGAHDYATGFPPGFSPKSVVSRLRKSVVEAADAGRHFLDMDTHVRHLFHNTVTAELQQLGFRVFNCNNDHNGDWRSVCWMPKSQTGQS